jgi:hypothetical protein
VRGVRRERQRRRVWKQRNDGDHLQLEDVKMATTTEVDDGKTREAEMVEGDEDQGRICSCR